MKVEIYDIGQVIEDKLKYAVIVSKTDDKIVMVRHNERSTWEIPGGRREINEDIKDTASRELYEETGAVDFDIQPMKDYGVVNGDDVSYGRIFSADIKKLGDLPNMEIEEVKLFDSLPENLTYPDIQPILYRAIVG